ncbi:MAG TPA: glutamate ABC transporter substrate-binding protein [Microlunatus sp.]|nr:glutamate ABC transporter substrate-binding protein [Microlunatus sp.]
MIARRFKPVVAALAAALALTLAGCGGSSEPNANPSVVPGATPGGTLRIGISFDQPGLGMKDGNTYSGFDVDTATYVAKALGVSPDKITWIEADPANRESLLSSGAVDLVFSTYSITDERKKVVDFAGPYFLAHQDLLVRRNEDQISGPETLDNRVLCSVAGTTSAALVKERFKGRIQLREYAKFSDCVAALDRSEVDAVTTDDVILAGFAAEPQYKGKLRVVGKGFSDEYYGVGIKKGDTARVEQVNAALKEYVADGSWKASLNRTVRPSGYKLPDPPSVGS